MPGLSIQYSSKAITANGKNVNETSFVHDEVAAIKNQINFGTLSLKLLLFIHFFHSSKKNWQNNPNNASFMYSYVKMLLQ